MRFASGREDSFTTEGTEDTENSEGEKAKMTSVFSVALS